MGRRGHIGRGALNCVETLLMHSNYNIELLMVFEVSAQREHTIVGSCLLELPAQPYKIKAFTN